MTPATSPPATCRPSAERAIDWTGSSCVRWKTTDPVRTSQTTACEPRAAASREPSPLNATPVTGNGSPGTRSSPRGAPVSADQSRTTPSKSPVATTSPAGSNTAARGLCALSSVASGSSPSGESRQTVTPRSPAPSARLPSRLRPTLRAGTAGPSRRRQTPAGPEVPNADVAAVERRGDESTLPVERDSVNWLARVDHRAQARAAQRPTELVTGLIGRGRRRRSRGEDDALLGIPVECGLGLRRELAREREARLTLGHRLLLDCLVPLHQGEQSEAGRHDDRDECSGDRDSLPASGRAPACQHVLELQRRGLRVVVGRPCGRPLLRVVQVAATEEEAGVAVQLLPLERPAEEPRVRPHPVEIRVERDDEGVDGGGKVVVRPEEGPVPGCERIGHRRPGRGCTPQHRHEPFVLLDRVRQLPRADVGGERVRRDHEEEVVRGLDAPVDLEQPLGGDRDVLPIRPDVFVVRGERGRTARARIRRRGGSTR